MKINRLKSWEAIYIFTHIWILEPQLQPVLWHRPGLDRVEQAIKGCKEHFEGEFGNLPSFSCYYPKVFLSDTSSGSCTETASLSQHLVRKGDEKNHQGKQLLQRGSRPRTLSTSLDPGWHSTSTSRLVLATWKWQPGLTAPPPLGSKLLGSGERNFSVRILIMWHSCIRKSLSSEF